MSEFWDLKWTTQIIETNEISSALRVSQDGVTVETREFAGGPPHRRQESSEASSLRSDGPGGPMILLRLTPAGGVG